MGLLILRNSDSTSSTPFIAGEPQWLWQPCRSVRGSQQRDPFPRQRLLQRQQLQVPEYRPRPRPLPPLPLAPTRALSWGAGGRAVRDPLTPSTPSLQPTASCWLRGLPALFEAHVTTAGTGGAKKGHHPRSRERPATVRPIQQSWRGGQ